MTDRVVLAYSGGLDTSVAIGWIAEETGAEVIAVAVDVGQGGEDLDVIRERALACGAVEAEVADARDEFADEYCLPALQANALYMDRYPLVSALSRPLIVKHLVAAARKHGATIVAHGCTGKGNDQVRFEVGIGALAPDLRCIAPVRDYGMTRDKAIELRRARRPADRRDQEVAVLDRPERLGPRRRDRLPRGHLERADRGRLRLHRRTRRSRATPTRSSSPSTTACRSRSTAGRSPMLQAIEQLNARAGAQGVGRLDMVEDRLVGIKSREVYEAPGRHRADHGAPGARERHRRARPRPVQARRSSSAGASWSTTGCGSRPLKRALDALPRRASTSTSPATSG